VVIEETVAEKTVSSGQQWPVADGWSSLGQVLPVLAFSEMDTIDPIVEALFAAGVKSLEITLRTPIALAAIEHCAQRFPECSVGAGTILTAVDVKNVQSAGAQFALSPGLLPEIILAADALRFPFIPGVTTASEVMQGLSCGITHFKFFPAVPAGGVPALQALGGPLPRANFCPTGGISAENGAAFLEQSNVFAVGMTRLVPKEMVANRDWSGLAAYVKQTLAQLSPR
jgi:2-dehydro-3-deoxyphosphogluconate aldolase/(4S)-4-hydroxy-2-oxoglutarate aldolase